MLEIPQASPWDVLDYTLCSIGLLPRQLHCGALLPRSPPLPGCGGWPLKVVSSQFPSSVLAAFCCLLWSFTSMLFPEILDVGGPRPAGPAQWAVGPASGPRQQALPFPKIVLKQSSKGYWRLWTAGQFPGNSILNLFPGDPNDNSSNIAGVGASLAVGLPAGPETPCHTKQHPVPPSNKWAATF